MKPADAVDAGLLPYPRFGIGGVFPDLSIGEEGWQGGVRQDFPWCPMWFYEYSTATVNGRPTLPVMEEAADFYETGQLSALFDPPYTRGFLDLLSIVVDLRKWAELRAQQRAQSDAQAKSRRQSFQ